MTTKFREGQKWSLRVIVFYLLIVLFIVLVNYYSLSFIPEWLKSESSIPPAIMITILSTTTVNIIGLGLIVLKGHFLAKESLDDNDNINPNNKKKKTEPL